MEISVKLFGKTKELEGSGQVVVWMERPLTVSEIRSELIKLFSEIQDPTQVKNLIEDCALGNQERILCDEDLIGEGQNLVLLPPVCGG